MLLPGRSSRPALVLSGLLVHKGEFVWIIVKDGGVDDSPHVPWMWVS